MEDKRYENLAIAIKGLQAEINNLKKEVAELKELKHKVLKTPINKQYDFKTICKMIKQIIVNYNILTIVIEINSVEYVDEVII